MDLRKIKKLMEMVEASGISELEVRSGDESVRIVRPLAGSVAAPEPTSRRVGPRQSTPPRDGQPVRAPMAGTFYAAPEPGADPYVLEGQSVEAGDVLCIIESMKMMNEIKAERSGTCTAAFVTNGQPVNAGDTLFRIA
jgi:acetyl-CoA carboxylase biotin carboxyl carrier protein